MAEDLSAKLILVVDDELDMRTYISTLLQDNGYGVITANDGKEALEIAQRDKPDLVILDLMMPNNTGTDFYRKLSKDKELGHTPIIVVSGLAGRELAVKESLAVFDKPVDPDEFLAAVGKALS